jgi:hypothetical protein
MMSLDTRLGAFAGAPNRPPSLGPFHPWISFSELTTKFFSSPSIEDSCFILPLCLDGSHQGGSITHETTHNEYLIMQKFIFMWHGPNMVSHMMPTMAHEFIDYEKDPWIEPTNGIYFA